MQAFPNAETKLLGVVGHPISHSLSPAFWNPTLREAGENAVFLAFDVEAGRFGDFITGMRAAGALGFNVTVPHKLAAAEIATELTGVAEAAGAVNVLAFRGDRIVGANTDIHGLKQAIGELDVEPKTALVIGAGGAGRAAVHALRDIAVAVTNRTQSKARELCDTVVDWDARNDAIGEFDLVVNATSVGLDGTGSVLENAALDAAASKDLKAVFDVVYRPDETRLVIAARAAGLEAADGLSMLVHQAAAAYQVLLNAIPPLRRMREYAWQCAGRPAEPPKESRHR